MSNIVDDTVVSLLTGIRDDGNEVTAAKRGTRMLIQGPCRCRYSALSSWEWFEGTPSDTPGVWWYRDELAIMRTVYVAEN